MPSTKRIDEVKMWQGRVKAAQRYQERVANTPGVDGTGKRRWDQNVAATAGDFNTKHELGDAGIDVNIIRSTMRTVLPPLKLVRPKINVKPTVKTYKGQNNERNAAHVETEINYWFRELKVRRQMAKVLTDAQSTNCGYLYMGMVDKKEDGYDASGDRTEYVPQVRYKQPFVRRHSPKMILVPPGYWDLEECPWVDIVFRRPLKYVLQKYKLKEEDVPVTEELDFGNSDRELDTAFLEYMTTDDVKFVRLHNIWDKESKLVRIFCEGMEDYLEEPKAWPWETEGFPIVHYRPEDISDQFYGTPPLTYIMPQQKELNAARTALKKRFGKSKATIWASTDIDDVVIAQYEKNPDGGVLKSGIDEDIRKHILVDPGLPLDAQALQYGQIIKADIIEQAGQSNEQRGAGDPNVDSATASANIQRNANIRSADAADAVRTAYLEVARKLWMMIARGPEVSVVRRVEGPIAGAFTEVSYSTKELRGEFQFEMDFSAKLPDTDAERLQTAMLRYNLFRMDPLVDPKELVLDVYKAQGEINPERALLFLRSPDEEHQMFMSGLQAEAHERDDHQAHMQAHNAFFEQLNQQIEQMEAQLGDERMAAGATGGPFMKLQAAMVLLTTHIQDHVRKVQALVGPGKKTEAVSKNQARAGIKSIGNSETEAELKGNPIGPVN